MNLLGRIVAFTLEPPNPLAGLLTGILLDSGQCEMESTQALSMNLGEIKQYLTSLTSDEIEQLSKALDVIENYNLARKNLQEEINKVNKLIEQIGKVKKLQEETGKVTELPQSPLSLEQRKQLQDWINALESQVRSLLPVERAADQAQEEVNDLLARVQTRKKNAEIEAEIKKKDAELREVALKQLNPPYEDAETYLSKEEYQEFQRLIPKAIDDHIRGYECYDYIFLVDKITKRKQDELEKLQAHSNAQRYLNQLENNVASFKSSLYQKRRNADAYFTKDPRYLGYSPASLPQDKERACEQIVTEHIKANIPENLQLFLSFKYRLAYRLLPHAEYSLIDDVPSLDFGFAVSVVTEIEYWLKPAQVNFGYWTFTIPRLEKPELLGYAYKLFTPSDLNAVGYYSWQTIPCILVQGLMHGAIEPHGTKITRATRGSTAYKVDGFAKEITIPDRFSKYLREISSWQGLVQKGVISSKVGEVVARAMERPIKELYSLETPKLNKGSKKARAFLLFNEGKRPGDPKVKSLGIKPQTAYRYYQDWKKLQHNSQNPT